MSSTRRMRNPELKALGYLRKHGIAEQSRVLVACSGGPDSVGLLSILNTLKTSYPLSLLAAHLDHGIRSARETGGDLDLVSRLCDTLGIELTWERIPRGALQERSRSEGRSLEEVAREARYDFLRKTARRKHCDYIALGHTADDQEETLIMRFLQGVDISGLPGIPERRGELIRPLFGCSRRELLDYLAERGLEFRLDPSNRDQRYLRNAVRLSLLPLVREIFPGVRRSLLELSRKLDRLRAFVESEARQRLVWQRIRGGYRISGRLFLAAPGILRIFSLQDLLKSMVRRRIPQRFLSRVEDGEYVRGRGVVLSGYGIRLSWRGEDLILTEDIVGLREKGYFIVVKAGQRVVLKQAGLIVDYDGPSDQRGEDRKKDYLLLRSPRVGDRLDVGRGKKAVKKLISEWGVSRRARWMLPVLEDRNGILAVLGSLLGHKDRFRTGTPAGRRNALKSMVYRYDVEVE